MSEFNASGRTASGAARGDETLTREARAPHRTLIALLRGRRYRSETVLFGTAYFVALHFALGAASRGGGAFGALFAPWRRMFERTGVFTFEAVAQLTTPGFTILISPVNLLVTGALAALAGLNLATTAAALRTPRACEFGRIPATLSALPPLLAGGACCAPTILLLLGIQASTMIIGLSQLLIPGSLLLLSVTLVWILRRTDAGVIAG